MLRTILCACVALTFGSAATGHGFVAHSTMTRIEPLALGDEPIVVTQHVIQTPDGPLKYEAQAGRLPIRVDETGEVHGYIFFVSYIVKNRGSARPLTFAWNGGPLVPSIYLHTELLGPRLLTPTGFVDNPETLLKTSDLVFYDAVETGFSRPATPAFAPDFMTMTGDVAATSEFIRAYRARFLAERQPLFLLGESYGVWRASAVAEFLARRGVRLSGVALISGTSSIGAMPSTFGDAMEIPGRTATAFFYHRLPPRLMRDREETMRQVYAWVRQTYLPALDHLSTLSPLERDKIARELADFIGIPQQNISRVTLVFGTSDFLSTFLGADKKSELSELDMRLSGPDVEMPGRSEYISRYLRDDLGYSTDLGYNNELNYMTDLEYRSLEGGYIADPGPGRKTIREQWLYNQSPGAAAALKASIATGEIKYMDNANPPWIRDVMALEPNLRLFVATGRYDPTNYCEGETLKTMTLPAALSVRITNRCYEGGHMMYRDAPERVKLLGDLATFVTSAPFLH